MAPSLYTLYIYLLFSLKIIFLILAIYDKYLLKSKKDAKKEKSVALWKSRIEYVFIILMAFLTIYLFNPFTKRPLVIDFHTKLLLFIYGIIVLLTSKGMVLDEGMASDTAPKTAPAPEAASFL